MNDPMRGRFEVLTQFQSAVSACRATAGDGRPLLLAEALARAVAWLDECRSAERKVMLVGNGGSAAIAGHQAVDLWRNAGLKAMSFNDPALVTCIANDFGYPEVFARPIAMFAEEGDVLVAISSSGRSANILRAVEMAKARGCRVIGLSGFEPDNPLRSACDLSLFVPSRSYGIVECAHLLLLHATVDEYRRLVETAGREEDRDEARDPESALLQPAPPSAD